MRTALGVIVFAGSSLLAFSAVLTTSAIAQDAAAVVAAEAACGPPSVEFHIKTDTVQHPAAQPDPGKALLYVILDEKFQTVRAVTARLGMDGAWIGAVRGNSYLFFSTDPGEHHLCTDWVSGLLPTGRLVSLAHFTAEPDHVYYFRVRTSGGPSSYMKDSERSASIDLILVDSDEGKLLVASSPWSNSKPKHPQASK
ncbi:MAG TPA: hypothetical protein VGS27_25975 [Candidatus Sulfotelmatobacter sp.]|nr:hypothetical protein [Candidatus Sulfotelmatobacter sp.]